MSRVEVTRDCALRTASGVGHTYRDRQRIDTETVIFSHP